MEHEKYTAILPLICADLVAYIADQENISDDEAILRLYSSKLYADLEQEDKKIWYYSTPMLYELYKHSEVTGQIDYPDV